MKYKVEWADEAIRDVEEIAEYIATHSSIEQAEYVVESVIAKVATLANSALLGGFPAELAESGIKDFRQLHCKPYRIIYLIDKKEVTILLLADGRRDMKSLLARRLLG
jgi:toxin ParE1/3/4